MATTADVIMETRRDRARDLDQALESMPGFEAFVDEADALGFTLTVAFPCTYVTWGTLTFTNREPPERPWNPRPILQARYDGKRWWWALENYTLEFESAAAAHVFESLGGWDR